MTSRWLYTTSDMPYRVRSVGSIDIFRQRNALLSDKGASSGNSVLITEYRLTTKPTTTKGYRN